MNLWLYLDESLIVREESDYLIRITTHPENHNIKDYHARKDRFGTVALFTNINQMNAQEVYSTYKSRNNIEIMFDGMKNIRAVDHTYMQDEQTLQDWMFVNHITLQWYQHLYIELKQKELIKKISVNDYIQLLTEVKQVLFNGKWHLNESNSHNQKLINRLGINLI
jgi:transposase